MCAFYNCAEGGVAIGNFAMRVTTKFCGFTSEGIRLRITHRWKKNHRGCDFWRISNEVPDHDC